MKLTHLFTALSLSALAVSCGSVKQEAKPQRSTELKSYHGSSVVFYNVENLFDTIDDPATSDEEFTPTGKNKWTADRYDTKLRHIQDAVLIKLTENPMLIGMVEVENSAVLTDLAKSGKFASTNYQVAHKESPDTRGIDVALLYDADRFQPTVVSALTVAIDSVPAFKTRDILYVQGNLQNGVKLHVFVNHWPSRREGEKESEYKRIRAAEVARAKVDEILKKDPDANILLMGDFNDHPDNASVREVLGAAPADDSAGKLVNLLFDDHAAGKGTHSYKGEWGVLDQLIVSRGLFEGRGKIEIEDKDATIVYDEMLLFTQKDGSKKPSTTYGGPNYYGGYSDHLPVFIRLR